MSQYVVPRSEKKRIKELERGETGRICAAMVYRTKDGLFVAADGWAETLSRWTQVWVTPVDGGVKLETARPVERMVGYDLKRCRKRKDCVTIGGRRVIPVVEHIVKEHA